MDAERGTIIPSTESGKNYLHNTAQSIATRPGLPDEPGTKDLYARYFTGHLIKIDPVTRVGEFVSETMPYTESYLVFDPHDRNIMYIAYPQLHCIGKFNLETMEHTVFVGDFGISGHADGLLSDARFSSPCQLAAGPDGNLYVADRNNHCIRMIDITTGMVSTVVGKPGIAGYQNGIAEDALFEGPTGVSVVETPDGIVMYIADCDNGTVRKLMQQ